MTRTVIGVSKTGQNVNATLERAPIIYEYDTVPLDLASVDEAGILERGQHLAALLRSGDPVRRGLDTLVSLPLGGDPSPLYFQIRSPAADAVAWEQIYASPVGFCALDRRSPVGRIADRVIGVKGRTFTPPLRLVAVLSAAQRDPAAQLKALRSAIAAYELPARLHVITGDADLLSELTGAGESGELIAGTGPEFTRQLTASRPHVLHLLCHGRKHSGAIVLDFATIGDVDGGEATEGGLKVSMTELVQALLPVDPWLVVLAACETADSGGLGVRPFVHDLVANGLTAAIGMRRLVDLTDTDRFCGELYPGLARTIRAAVDPPGRGEQVIDWAACLTGPRQLLASPDPSVVDRWLDPVLYVQSEDLRVIAEGTAHAGDVAQLQGRLDTLRAFRAQCTSDTDPAVLAEVDRWIAESEAALGGAGQDVGEAHHVR